MHTSTILPMGVTFSHKLGYTNELFPSQSWLIVLKHRLVTKRDSAHITNAKKVIYLSECIYLGFL